MDKKLAFDQCFVDSIGYVDWAVTITSYRLGLCRMLQSVVSSIQGQCFVVRFRSC